MRRSGRLLVAGVLVAIAVGPVVPSHAMLREAVAIKEGTAVTKTFPALLGSVPQSERQVRPNPADCAKYTWCDTVPLDVTPPAGLKDSDDFFVEVKIAWDNPSGQDDIDTFTYDDQQIKGGSGYTLKASGASSDNPETNRLFRPTLGRYNLVVLNFVGPNTGYKVTGKLIKAAYQAPFEVLAPEKKSPATTTTTTTRPVESTAPPATAPGETPSPTLAPAAPNTDSDFDFGNSDFDQQLAAPPVPDGSIDQAQPASSVKKVGGGVVALWFVVSPLILLGGTAFFFLRRRNAA